MVERSLGLAGLGLLVACALGVEASQQMDSPAKTARLHIKVIGLASSDGRVKVGLYDSRLNYESRTGSFRKATLPIYDQVCEWVLDEIPLGEYALMLYHDQNGNQRLDKNFFGIPREPYGFSNNAKPSLGVPGFDKVAFAVKAEFTELAVKIQ